MQKFFYLLFLSAFSWSSFAQQPYHPVQFEEEIKLDGNLDEPVWSLAQPITDAQQQIPKAGNPAAEKLKSRAKDKPFCRVTVYYLNKWIRANQQKANKT